MSNDNQVTVIGNITNDPELKYLDTEGKPALCQFGIAVNKRRFNRDTNQWEDIDTSFFDVSCWRGLAEHVAASVDKGTRVVVTGELRQDQWEDKESGQKRYKVAITANDVAVSLLFGTASFEKVSRNDSGGPVPTPPPVEQFAGHDEPF